MFICTVLSVVWFYVCRNFRSIYATQYSFSRFGRYTVAALEAKIQHYERDVDHLKRALERSDQYIEDMESRIRKSEKNCSEVQEASGSSNVGSGSLTQHQKISMMIRSLSDNERASICSNPETECRTFSRNHSLVFMPSADHREFSKNPTVERKSENLETASPDILPTTPSTAFRSLTLRSPGIREKKVAFKPASYLRRLDFEDFPSPDKATSNTENQFISLDKFPKASASDADADVEPNESVLWVGWERSNPNEQPCTSTDSSVKASTSVLVGNVSDTFQMSSEASMDAAYLDKISELDSMMLDGESSSSRGSQLSINYSPATDMDNTLVPEPQRSDHSPHIEAGSALSDKVAPKDDDDDVFVGLVSGRDALVGVSGCTKSRVPSQTEELSFDLLFDTPEENQAGPSDSLGPVSKDVNHDPVNTSSSSSIAICNGKPANTAPDRHTLISQAAKRKSHSPFSTSSPTKHSKLM